MATTQDTPTALPDPEALLADPTLADQYANTDQVDEIAAAVVARLNKSPRPQAETPTRGLLAWAIDPDRDADRWRACGDILARLATADASDTFYEAARHWAAARPVGVYPEDLTPEVIPALQPMLRKRGVWQD